jgi:hypothetical protein
MFGNAATGLHTFATQLAALGTSFLEIAVLILGVLIISSVGGTGVHKFLRQAIFVVGLGALFLKTYTGIATGALGLFWIASRYLGVF